MSESACMCVGGGFVGEYMGMFSMDEYITVLPIHLFFLNGNTKGVAMLTKPLKIQ